MKYIEVFNYAVAVSLTLLVTLMLFLGAAWCVHRVKMSKVIYLIALVVSGLTGFCMYLLAITLNSLYL